MDQGVVKEVYGVILVVMIRFCKEGHHRCMEETTVDEVYRAIIDLTGKK